MVLLLPDFLGLPFNPRAARCPVGEDLVCAGTLALVTGQSPSPSSWPTTQVVQLLTCDLLLSLRTTLWQKQAGASQALGETYHASGAELAGFQRDLGSLRRLAHSFRPAYRKVRPSLLLGRVDQGVRTEPSSGVGSWSRLTGQALGWVPFIPLAHAVCAPPWNVAVSSPHGTDRPAEISPYQLTLGSKKGLLVCVRTAGVGGGMSTGEHC